MLGLQWCLEETGIVVTLEGEGGNGPLSSPSFLDVAYWGQNSQMPQGPSLLFDPLSFECEWNPWI